MMRGRRDRTRRDAPEALGPILGDLLAEKGYLTICKENSILLEWDRIVDPKFAAVSKCEKVENGILYVKVSSSPWRQEASYHKHTILERIHREFGCPTIKDIVFI
jgi:predicted nucleic acid-binding Zn ribbon protein